jgi:hypothetical protein
VFQQIKGMLNQTSPHIKVEGGNYPTAEWKQWLSKLVGFGQMGLFAVIFLGSTIT